MMTKPFDSTSDNDILVCDITGVRLDIDRDSVFFLMFSYESGIRAAELWYTGREHTAPHLDPEIVAWKAEGYHFESFQAGIWFYESQLTK